MSIFAGFENYRVVSWIADGLLTRAENLVESATASLKSAGAVAAVSLAVLATPSVALASDSVAFTQTRMTASLSEGLYVVEHVNGMSRDIRAQLDRLDQVSESDIDPLTLSLAQQVALTLSQSPMSFSADWATRLVSGKP